MDQILLGDGRCHFSIAIAQRVDSDTSNTIEVAPSHRIIQVHTLAVVEHKIRAGICLKDIVVFVAYSLLRHGQCNLLMHVARATSVGRYSRRRLYHRSVSRQKAIGSQQVMGRCRGEAVAHGNNR